MPSGLSSDQKVKIAHVLMMDVVGYSALLIDEQSRVIAELNRSVRESARFRQAEISGKLIRLPTGDGMVLVFFDDAEAPLECAVQVGSALKNRPELKIRMGIHSGPINQVLDVNDRSNVAGAGIDVAQRVMDCGDAGHILLSRRVAEDLAPLPRWNPHLHDLGECEVKHGRKISLVNFYTDEIGNPKLPLKVRHLRKSSSRTRLSDWLGAPVSSAVMMIITLLAIAMAYLLAVHWPSKIRVGSSAGQQDAKSIAVLPFENLSHDPENTYFADGIQEEILSRLSRIADLKVISRTSTQQYKSAPNNLKEIAEQLGVANILEGTVQKAADQVRVNVQLIDARKDSHLWADNYDRKLTDVFAVESEIATKIANTLQAKLTKSEEIGIAIRPTNDSDAHQLYLKGRYFWGKQTGADLEKAIDYFSHAIAKDPHYAAAYAGLADCYVVLPFWTPAARSECMVKAKGAAEKALEIDDTLAEAHVSLGSLLFFADFNVGRARREFESALELNANYAPAHQAFATQVLPVAGELDRAIAELKRAVELDPFSVFINTNLGYVYIMARRYPDAITQLEKTIELNPDYYLSHRCLAQALELSGHLEQATAEYEKPHEPNDEPYVLGFRAHIYALKGDREKAQQLLGQMKELTAHSNVWPLDIDYCFTLAYLGLGEKDEAINWLERSRQDKEYETLSFAKLDPMLDSLRGNPRFEQFVNQVLLSSRLH